MDETAVQELARDQRDGLHRGERTGPQGIDELRGRDAPSGDERIESIVAPLRQQEHLVAVDDDACGDDRERDDRRPPGRVRVA